MGADYSILVTPYYNKPTQTGLLKQFEAIADAVEIKQILYNVPSRTSCDLLPTTIEYLSEHKNIIGIKEAVDTENRIKDLLKISKSSNNFVVFSGDDPTFCNSLNLGCKGVISVVANIIPRQISEICDFALSGSINHANTCLLYTSDAADEEDSVDLGGRRIIKKKKQKADANDHDNK